VIRPIGGSVIRELDPFLLLDHMGPIEYGPHEAVGAPDHPHRGFETVLYLLEGETGYLDSLGNKGLITAGMVEWLTAGSGIVHCGFPSQNRWENGGRLQGLQLWVNLPKKFKMIQPQHQYINKDTMPVAVSKDGLVTVKVISGESLGVQAIIHTKTPIIYLDISLEAGGRLEQPLPIDFQGLCYVLEGSALFGANRVKASATDAAIFVSTSQIDHNFITIEANQQRCKVMLIAGLPLNEPIARHGPFVMNTQKEIEQCFIDYQRGKMGSIPGGEERKKLAEIGRANFQRRIRDSKVE